jgi:hypothetical protein
VAEQSRPPSVAGVDVGEGLDSLSDGGLVLDGGKGRHLLGMAFG